MGSHGKLFLLTGLFALLGLGYRGYRYWLVYFKEHLSEEPLRFDATGITVEQSQERFYIAWRDVYDYRFHRVSLDEDREEDDWFQVETRSRGTVSVRLNAIDYGDFAAFRERLDAWRRWAHQERLRVAMGGAARYT